MIHDSLYKGELYMFGVGNLEFVTSLTVMQRDGLEGEYGEAYHTLVTDNLNAVLLGGFIGHETP